MDADPVTLQAFIQGARIGLGLPVGIGVDLASHNPGIGQHHQAVDKHLAATIQAPGKWLDATLLLDQRAPLGDIDSVEQVAVALVITLACEQGCTQGITHRANADLQGAAVAYQGAGMQADHMVLQIDRHAGR
ncbi:hypothetical protein PS685_04292 [Pseudomonas fluorescens]|uniref:Uncharacterized protein n=1 Tax=Pseudomonas fluorescens TaxID=294 RepID=A0A5E6ZC25_PSEFL|nr:hypothetical protein PS685_04292 [Pseudomonas fluorescens]